MVDHGIYGRRAAQDATARPVETAISYVLLFDGIVIPVMLGVKQFGEENRDFCLKDDVVAACLEQQDRDVLVLGKFISEDTASSASSHNDWLIMSSVQCTR